MRTEGKREGEMRGQRGKGEEEDKSQDGGEPRDDD